MIYPGIYHGSDLAWPPLVVLDLRWQGTGNVSCAICAPVHFEEILFHRQGKWKTFSSANRKNLSMKLNAFLGVPDVVRNGFSNGQSYGSGHLYICESCVLSIEAWEKAESRKNTWLETYRDSAMDSASIASTPTKTSKKPAGDGCEKRMAIENPPKAVKTSRSRLFGPTTTSAAVPTIPPSHTEEVTNSLSPALSRMRVTDADSTRDTKVSKVEVGSL